MPPCHYTFIFALILLLTPLIVVTPHAIISRRYFAATPLARCRRLIFFDASRYAIDISLRHADYASRQYAALRYAVSAFLFFDATACRATRHFFFMLLLHYLPCR